MNIRHFIGLSVLPFLCALAAACSDDESTIVPTPEPRNGQIAQIRIESGETTRLLDFLYDDAGRVTQQITTTAPNRSRAGGEAELSTAIVRYSYADGRIGIAPSSGGELSLVLDAEGKAVRVEPDEGTAIDYTYNTGGYYYEEPSTDAWCDYEYLFSGNRCNLARITAYGAQSLLGTSETERSAVFEYGNAANDANLDLSYLLSREVQSERLRLTDAPLFGWCGPRDSNLPATLRIEHPRSGSTEEYTFGYESDAEGRVVRMDALRNNTSEHIRYTITYSR